MEKIKKHIDNLKNYVKQDTIYQNYKDGVLDSYSDFDMFCINHCKDIEALIQEFERED